MPIVQVSKADRTGGGASRVAEMLHRALLARGVSSAHYARHPGDAADAPVPLAWTGFPLRQAEHTLQRLTRAAGWPYVIPTEYPRLRRVAQRGDALFHFHDLSGGISPLTLQLLSRHAPVVWTLHDCSAVTGGCLYPMDCTRYLEHCGNCPQRGAWPLNTLRDGTRQMRALQWWLHRKGALHYVSPSRWLASLVQGCGAIDRVIVIPNGVDIDVFRPAPQRRQLRASLGIPAERPAVLISASYLDDRRKGTREALQALSLLPQESRPFVLLLGKGQAQPPGPLAGFDFKHFGYVDEAARLADIYCAADAFLNCTLADNFPLAALESLACGTPVLGFRTGGLPEMIDDGRCGALVEQGDVAALASLLHRFLQARIGSDWRQQARAHVCAHFSLERQVDAHLDLYRALAKSAA